MSSDAELGALLAGARSLLFVPGNRPERFAKALHSGADAVVLDLEDSVPGPQKALAREAIVQAWPQVGGGAVPIVVRLNALDSDAGHDDLAWLARFPGGVGWMLSKTESADQLARVRALRPDAPLLPLIESASGCLRLAEIAGSPGVLRLLLGHIDLMADTGIRCSDDERELHPLRFQMALHTRVNRLAPPVDGVTVSIDDADRLTRDARRALHFGFGGKLCIHPRQVPVVHAALAPSADEVAWARRVVAADEQAGGQAVQLDGRMVDLPVVLQAKATLARANRSRPATRG